MYDVLRLTLFFKAFLVYMQEFWATTTVHHHSIRFKMDNKKHIVNLESFREMLHIFPRLPHQPFVEPPFEEEILAFLRFLRHSAVIRKLTDVEHKDTKKNNKMYYPRFTKVIIHHFMSKDPSIPRRNKVNEHYVRDDHMFSTIKLVSRHQNTQQFGAPLPIELTNEDIRNSNAYKEYYAFVTGATPPKPKASIRKTRSSFDTTITPPTAAAGPRLATFEKGKQTAKASKAKNEGTGYIPRVLDVPTDESEEEISWNSTDEEGDDDEGKDGDGDDDDNGDDGEEGDGDGDDEDDDGEEGNDDDDQEDEGDDGKDDKEDEGGNGEEDLGLNVGREEGRDKEEEEDELYRDVNINQGRGIQMTQEIEDSHVTLTPVNPNDNDEFLKTIDENMKKIIKEQVKEQVKVQVSKILPRIEQTENEQLEAKVLTRSSNSSKTSYVVVADLFEMELKKILIEKIEGNKSIHRSNEQRNLYKALVEAYEFDKIILNTYGETVTLKRRHDDDADKDEEPFAGSDRGSKRRREGKEPDKFAATEEPMQTTFEMEEPAYPTFETGADDQPIVESSQHPECELAKQSDSRSSFNELMDTLVEFFNFLMNRLKVDTLTPELLAGPTYELLKGSCKSLVELEYHLEEVYKATTDQLDWVNPEGQQYPHNLLKPLPLISNNQGHRVIPFDHFINNDLEYLRGGASSQKYTTSVTKTKAADYGHIKWIEDLMPRTMWIQEPIGYDKHSLCEESSLSLNSILSSGITTSTWIG
nr:hypothetical protein [Tanacetum cinerariifolium]